MAPNFQLFIFDSTRGQQEGHELDKVLFFHPLDLPLPDQLSKVSLSEGLVVFSRHFSPTSPCEFMEAEKHFHIFFQCEPDIWIVMIIEKSTDAELLTRDNAYRNVLKQMYSMFRLFYGSIRSLLRNNPLADVVRNCLYTFVPDFISEISSGKNLWLPTISDSLTEAGTILKLRLGSEVLLEAQSLVELLQSWSAGDTVRHSIILFHKYLVSSTLPADDTAAMYSYATLRLVPSAITRSFTQGIRRSYSRSSVINTVVSTLLSDGKRNPIPTESYGDSTDDRINACRPLKQEAWWQDTDGFLATNAWSVDAVPSVCVEGATTRMQLCIYQHRALTLLVLVPVPSGFETMGLLRKQILEKAAYKIQMLEEKLTREWGGNNSLHVPGYRYLHQDSNTMVVKASPPTKVATLAKDSLVALDRVRSQVDLEKARMELGREYEHGREVCVRTKNNAWVSTRTRDGQDLYVVLEKASDTLLLASDSIDKFNKRHCDGKFTSE